jgi:ferritin
MSLDKTIVLLDESIALEMNMASLYQIFQQTFSDDALFWRELTREEMDHATLLKSAKENLGTDCDKLPNDFLCESLEKLKATNKKITQNINDFRDTCPSRKQAFNTAFAFENSAGEIHYNYFMNKLAVSPLEEILQELNQNDKNHGQRIRSYMEKNNIILD